MSERIRFGRQQGIHAHFRVVDMARDLCMASYDAAMANNTVRSTWKARHPTMTERQLQVAWLCKHLAAHIAPARAILAGMLSAPIDEGLKEKIKDALVMDNFLTRGRNPAGWRRPPESPK
jgi:hypothetical protein